MTLATTLPDRLLQFMRGPKMRAWVAAKGERSDAFEAAVSAVMQSFDLATATGDRLDKLGSILQLPRQGQPDDRYRLLLQIQVVLILASQGTTATMLEVVRRFTGYDAHAYSEHHPARIDISATLDDLDDAPALLGLLMRAKPGGVALNVLTAAADDALILDDVTSLQFFASQPEVRFMSASIGSPDDWAALAVDLSPYGEDLTPQGSPSNRAENSAHTPTDGLLGDKCIELLVEMSETAATAVAVIKRLFPSSDAVWDIRKSSGSAPLRCVHHASPTVVQATIPGLSATPNRYYVAWSDAANPDTTGPSNARRSTLRIWQIDSGAPVAYSSATATHVIPANDTPGLIVGAFSATGASLWNQNGQSIEMLRISDRPRTREEIETYMPAVLANFPVQPIADTRELDDVNSPLANAGTLANINQL